MRARLLTLTLLGAAALIPASAARASGTDALVPGTAGATAVTAYGGDLAWSRLDSDGAYHLVTDIAGVISEPPVPSETTPFAVDLGNEGNGAVIAVYPRCERTCDIKALAIDASEGERSALRVNTSSCDEVAPSTDDGVLAFIRRGPHCAHPGLYARVGGSVRLLTTKVSKTVHVPTSTDCTPTRVVYDYRPTASSGDSYIRQVSLRTRVAKTLAHAVATDAGGDRFSEPVVDGTTSYWLDASPIDETARVTRLNVGPLEIPAAPSSYAVSSGVVYYTASDGLHRFTPAP